MLLVCTSLISNGEQQDEETVGGQRRSEALRMLCEMCPSQALTIRALCVSNKLFMCVCVCTHSAL